MLIKFLKVENGINTHKTALKTKESYGITAFFIIETVSHVELIAPPGEVRDSNRLTFGYSRIRLCLSILCGHSSPVEKIMI